MARPIKLLLLLLVAILASQSEGAIPDTVSRRHDYKHAIKKPIVFGEGILPHFEVSGDLLSSEEWLRIVPSVQSKKGGVWSTRPVTYANWEVVMSFSISGRGRLGGDGMAMWLTKEHLQQGEAMGAQEQWDGLMLFFDTYDNDNKRNNPYVGAIFNDGTLRFSPDTDGSDLVFNGCQRNFRNTPVPVYLRVTYYRGTLSVGMDTVSRGKAFLPCFEQQGVQIPQGYYFGVTAATGGLADDHDLLSFEVYELDPPPRAIPEKKPAEEEKPAAQEVDQEQFEKIQEKVQEIRAKQDVFEVDETYNFFMEKISNMEELLNGLAHITNTQEQIRQAANTALGLIETLYTKTPSANPSLNPAANSHPYPNAPNPNLLKSHGQNTNNHNSPSNHLPIVPIMNKLGEVQSDLKKLAAKTQDPSFAVVSQVATLQDVLKQIDSRLAKIEADSSTAGANQLVQILREELARGGIKAPGSSTSGGPRRAQIQEESDSTLLIIVVVLVALTALAGGAYYVANRKNNHRKFI